MRKFILITAMVLASASAHAGQRSLTVASSEQPATTATTATAADAPAVAPAATTPAVTSPSYVERPSAAAPAADCAPTTAEAPKSAPKDVAAGEKPRHRHVSTEARVISELHRHGIYW
jgi:hypothetical protein